MLSELLPEDKRRLHELEIQLVELEKENPNVHFFDVSLSVNEMGGRIEELEKLANRESKARRNDEKRRVQHLRVSYNHIKSSLENLSKKKEQAHFDARKYLMGDLNGNTAKFDLEAAENVSLNRSSAMINDYLETGKETLSELLSQRDRLKSIQRKVFDILNLLGVSNSIMRVVERRENVDKWIVFGGMFCILALMFVIYYYYKR